jgi:hypothetical protein
MKIKYLVVIYLLTSCTTARKVIQQVNTNPKYVFKSIDKFKGDTIAYNVYNFIDRKDLFINKPASLILDNINYEIESYLPITDLDDNIFGIYVYPYSENERRGQDIKNIKSVHLIIEFTSSVSYISFLKTVPEGTNNSNWTPILKDFFGKFKVSNIKQIDHFYKKKN